MFNIVILILALLLNSCAWLKKDQTAPIPKKDATNFERALLTAYTTKANDLFYMDNEPCSKYMLTLARDFVRGSSILPQKPDTNEELLQSEFNPSQMDQERQRLIRLMQTHPIDTRVENPNLTAHTQASLECWIGCSSISPKHHSIKLCYNSYVNNMYRLNQMISNHARFRDFANNVNSIYFNFDESTLTGDAKERLNYIIKELAQVRGVKLLIYGYTDKVGSAKSNLSLAAQRVQTVKTHLLNSGVINSNNIKIEEAILGTDDPVTTKITVNNNPHSRRVDIFVEQ